MINLDKTTLLFLDEIALHLADEFRREGVAPDKIADALTTERLERAFRARLQRQKDIAFFMQSGVMFNNIGTDREEYVGQDDEARNEIRRIMCRRIHGQAQTP